MNRIYMNHAWGYKLPEPFDKADTTSYKHIQYIMMVVQRVHCMLQH